ncbi:pyridoxal phosphate enzyme, YggS family [Porphyromonas sp. oral taxon 278 str. W7784]|uniref:YggS family pyridoxal phosphate-dependent enzyme n=1 Tax=Porphyromonas sp. oral taxon 278 TaxID=712437 RepID=UPI0003AD4B22|nr:YggS family pyridoxal phosphate-dependent enzyme [Porphyromonas sp. oral taxon 278]ERJ71779.1 pyridoxal phosphate enzyme, YggS family [Porphyromonas sp. oral taxon 278 str. W7784]
MKPLSSEDISQRLASIQESLTSSARLVAVSKFHPASYVEMAYEAGQRIFGESRVQELVDKWERLHQSYPDIVWHFIGPLQTNKVKYIAPFISMIESVTSERLLAEICRQAQRVGRTIPILLEVHVAEEETKSGFTPDEIRALVTRIHDEPELYRGVALQGLMAMASHVEDEAKISEEFASVRRLFEELRASGLLLSPELFTELSMGMSGDYPLALREGATLIRIGSAIFGDRA